jgi:hypothetical protein
LYRVAINSNPVQPTLYIESKLIDSTLGTSIVF